MFLCVIQRGPTGSTLRTLLHARRWRVFVTVFFVLFLLCGSGSFVGLTVSAVFRARAPACVFLFPVCYIQ